MHYFIYILLVHILVWVCAVSIFAYTNDNIGSRMRSLISSAYINEVAFAFALCCYYYYNKNVWDRACDDLFFS